MISSMTAFGRAEQSADWGSAVWEVRSVNHRFLDISVRLPDDLRTLEAGVRDCAARRLTRGKVECQLRFEAPAASSDALSVDSELAARVLAAAESLPARAPLAVNALDVLRWPGVLRRETPDAEALGDKLLVLLDRALDALVDMRRREGARIRELIMERCEAVRSITARVRERLPVVLDALRDRYRRKAEDLAVQLDPERLEQELLLLSQKMDVAEELERLESHAAEVLRVIGAGEPAGRRLDFLMQEMNRESNTLGSKSADLEVTAACVDLKVLIEQMREQIQNVE
jgi:uncharacterized protein (TIGR00255 family)